MYEWFTYISPDSKTKQPSICMVFDLLVGSTYQLIKKGKYEDGLDEKIVLNIIKQISKALLVLKNDLNACHTDIKPENILIKGIDNRINIFSNKFLEEEFPKKFKIVCDKIITDNNFKLTNQKHKIKYNKIKKEICKKIVLDVDNVNNKIYIYGDDDTLPVPVPQLYIITIPQGHPMDRRMIVATALLNSAIEGRQG